MSSKHLVAHFFALLLALALGCASTPARRIESDPEPFASYVTEDQEKIRNGQVALGFDEDQVRYALGEPDEISTQVDSSGETMTWVYSSSRPGVSVGLGGFGIGGIGLGGGVGVGSGSKTSVEAVVEFREGRVTKIRRFED